MIICTVVPQYHTAGMAGQLSTGGRVIHRVINRASERKRKKSKTTERRIIAVYYSTKRLIIVIVSTLII